MMAKMKTTNVLIIIFVVDICLFVIGVALSWVDIQTFGSGLYLALVSIVTLVIVLAFCLVGPDEHHEPMAKQMWSKSRQTIRRYTVRNPRLITNPLKPLSPGPPPDSDTPNENDTTDQDIEANHQIKVHIQSPEPTTKSESECYEKLDESHKTDSTAISFHNGVRSSDSTHKIPLNESLVNGCQVQAIQFVESEETAVFV